MVILVVLVTALLLRLSGRDIALAPSLLFPVCRPSRWISSGKRIMMPAMVAIVFMLMTPAFVFPLPLMFAMLSAAVLIAVLVVIASDRRHGQTQAQKRY